jgi:hypothetical protein
MMVAGGKLLGALEKFQLSANMKEMHNMVVTTLTAKMRMRATYEVTIGLAEHIKSVVGARSVAAGANVLLWQKKWKALDDMGKMQKTLEDVFEYTEDDWYMHKLNKLTLQTWEDLNKSNEAAYKAAVKELKLNPDLWQSWQREWSHPVTTPGTK